MKRPTMLMIMDGLGLTEEVKGNAVKAAKTPVLDRLMKDYPFVQGQASGLHVGLPDGQMGNSEVGHMNMGAGRIIYQDLTRITKDIEDGGFFENEALLTAMKKAAGEGSALHLFGLVSDGGVHSHITHIYALLEMAKRQGVKDVIVHAFLDGRDTPPTSGLSYVQALEAKMAELGIGKIGTISGRYYAMDRDNRWERLEKAYRALTLGAGVPAEDPDAALQASYDEGVTDEFVVPIVLYEGGEPVRRVQSGDAVIFFNFRPDRAREISRAFLDPDFTGFERKQLEDLTYVFFTDYDPTIPNHLVAYGKESYFNTLGQYVSSLGLKQLRIAETEKYAHVTFFFNSGVETPYEGEDRILVPSPKVATYDLQPEMSAYTVCDKLCEAIESGKYDLIVINFANPDMVGHTGVYEAAVAAVEAVDTCVGRAVDSLLKVGGQMFLCADHGNCEKMWDDEANAPMTAHTTNPVPFILIGADEGLSLMEGGRLCDIAPTLLELMGIPQPKEMTGHSLLVRS
ncbi:MAG: 2,3-bisphosphoglycerate-independent phosphoglycerate mutase [Lachnospiraceae bacterium]|nr:2,3-bisphosphoglycerate-independent phosphoglycerate mutase [Lachnospiraceae bacterium]